MQTFSSVENKFFEDYGSTTLKTIASGAFEKNGVGVAIISFISDHFSFFVKNESPDKCDGLTFTTSRSEAENIIFILSRTIGVKF